MRRAWVRALLLLCVSSRYVRAGGGPATDAYDEIAPAAALDLHGLADVYVLRNFANPVTGRNELREFDYASNTAALTYLRLTLAHHPGRVGFRLDVGMGSTADVYRIQDPAVAYNPDLARALSYVEQAFVTVVVPLSRDVSFDAGRFATPVGLEDNETLSNWNYSRSLLYSWAEPSLHTGVRASAQMSDAWAVSAFWVNGWNSVVVRGNGMRSVAGAVSWKPSAQAELALVYMAGLERPPTELSAPLSMRHMVSGYVIYRFTPRVLGALASDYGHDEAAGGVSWWGTSAYARVAALSWLFATVRAEYLADADGFVTALRQRVAGVTTTVAAQHKVGPVLLDVRLEYRHDASSVPAFDGTRRDMLRHQDSVTMGLLATF
jgi:hypothetical protein